MSSSGATFPGNNFGGSSSDSNFGHIEVHGLPAILAIVVVILAIGIGFCVYDCRKRRLAANQGKRKIGRMQAIKDKMHDVSEMRKVKAEAREEEKAEKDLAKARMEVAHEVRLAKEAEAAMDLHVNKAAEKARRHEAKHPAHCDQTLDDDSQDPYGHSSSFQDCSNQMYADSTKATYADSNTGNLGSNTATGITGYATNSSGGQTTK